MRLSLVLAGAIVCAASAACSGDRQAPAAAVAPSMRDDLRILETTLVAAHPRLFFRESEATFRRALANADRKLSRGATPREAFLRIAPIVGAIGDAHTSVDPYTADYVSYRDSGGRLFPLELRFDGGRATVVASYGNASVIPPGSTVASIDGIAVSPFLASLEPYVGGGRPALRAWEIGTTLRELLWQRGVAPPYDVVAHVRDRAVRAKLEGCTIDDIHAWDASPDGTRQLDPFRFEIDRKSGAGIMTIHSFDGDAEPRFRSFLRASFASLRERRVGALLIDIRQNEGGDTQLGDDLLDAFASRPYRQISRMWTKVSRTTKDGLGHDRYVLQFGERAWNARDGTTLETDLSPADPEPAAKRFRGAVYVLIGDGTFSAAAMFAAAVQDSKNGAVWGRISGGDATLYGERFDFTLPRSRLSVSVSTKFFIRPNGDARPGGVTPDRSLEATPEGPDDRELATALDDIGRANRRSVP